MKLRQQLNPFNHLFGRIFIVFWLLILMILAVMAWVIVKFNDDGQMKPATRYQTDKLLVHTTALQKAIDEQPKFRMQRIVSRSASKERTHMVLVNLESENIIYSMRDRERTAPQHLLNLAQQKAPMAMVLRPYNFIGASFIQRGESKYALLVGRKTERGLLKKTIDTYPIMLLIVPIILSSILCMILAWSLSRPLRNLRRAVQQMQRGNMIAHVKVSDSLNDEISHLGREFNRMSAQVADVLAGQRRLLADISHELRTPLARLNLIIGIANKNEEIPQKHLNRIAKEADLIDDMVGQILQLSRLESDIISVQPQPVMIKSFISSLLDDAKYEANAQNKTLTVEKFDDAQLCLDHKLMLSAIENIVRNGIKYCSSQVIVTITKRPPSTLIISVKDDGNGLSESELKHIFNPFYRSDSNENTNVDGFGLGLAIASRAIELHSGGLTAINNADGGLQISITLPTSDADNTG